MQDLSTSDGIDIEGIRIPDDFCCNCGGSKDLALVPTPLKKTRFMLLGGTELTITLGFPYCSGCAATASRQAIGAFGKLLIAFVFFWILLFIVIFLPFDLASFLPGAMLPLAAFAIALVTTVGYFRMRQPRPPKTSADQPVMLRGVKQLFGGDVVGLRLGFSNRNFKKRFDSLNESQIASGALTTESVG